MNLREDFKHPLDAIENVLLRRIALIITSFDDTRNIYILCVHEGNRIYL